MTSQEEEDAAIRTKNDAKKMRKKCDADLEAGEISEEGEILSDSQDTSSPDEEDMNRMERKPPPRQHRPREFPPDFNPPPRDFPPRDAPENLLVPI